jgi:heme exporter protein B
MLKLLISLVRKELVLEFRNKTTLTGLLIYVISALFIAYLSFRQIIDIPTWNSLLWIIILFATTNAVARSFLSETDGVRLFNYLLISPVTLIIGRSVVNLLILFILALITYTFYSLLIGNPVSDNLMFLTGLIVGVACLSTTFTLISGIAAKAGGNASMIAILGFPVIIPTLLTCIRFSKNAIDGIAWSVNVSYLLVLLALLVISTVLAVLLFPYLWKD